MPSAEPAVNLPPLLAARCEKLLPALLNLIDPDRAVAMVERIVAHDRWNSFDHFHKTSRELLAAYEAAGARSELYSIPTGGPRGDGRWIIPEAEDFVDASIDLISPVERRVADYRICPWHVAQWSAATPTDGIVAELTVIDSEETLKRLPAGALAGRIALSRLDPWKYRLDFVAAGALGLICDAPVPDRPDAVAWIKFGWGGLDLVSEASPLVGFSISSDQGNELRELQAQHGRLIVRTRLDVRKYAGSHDLVSGIITGRKEPNSEIWAIAHCAEPGALDNASGVAACVEIARLLSELMRRGTLPPPRRTIRLLHGYECYGFFHHLEHSGRPLAGVCIDTMGARADLCRGEVRWHCSAPGSASFAEDLGAGIIQTALKPRPIYHLRRMPFLSTEDTLLGDPQFGFPCPWITSHPFPGYHSSADTPDLIDPQGLAVTAAAMACYLYCLADLNADEAAEIARWQAARVEERLSRDAKMSDAHRTTLLSRHRATINSLERFNTTSDSDKNASSLSRLSQPTPSNTELRASAASHLDSRAARVPIRCRPLVPTPENVPASILRRLGTSFPKWAVFWADGSRTIAEIHQLAALDCEAALSLAEFIDYFEALQELGYISWRESE